jgi:hypothetical protein
MSNNLIDVDLRDYIFKLRLVPQTLASKSIRAFKLPQKCRPERMTLYCGAGNPNDSVPGNVRDIFQSLDGTSRKALLVKEADNGTISALTFHNFLTTTIYIDGL